MATTPCFATMARSRAAGAATGGPFGEPRVAVGFRGRAGPVLELAHVPDRERVEGSGDKQTGPGRELLGRAPVEPHPDGGTPADPEEERRGLPHRRVDPRVVARVDRVPDRTLDEDLRAPRTTRWRGRAGRVDGRVAVGGARSAASRGTGCGSGTTPPGDRSRTPTGSTRGRDRASGSEIPCAPTPRRRGRPTCVPGSTCGGGSRACRPGVPAATRPGGTRRRAGRHPRTADPPRRRPAPARPGRRGRGRPATPRSARPATRRGRRRARRRRPRATQNPRRASW